MIVLSRHAGPGDSFLLVHHLLSRYRRKPRIVMKAALQFDPSLDVVINRLPNAFVPARHRSPGNLVIKEIQRLAAGLGPTGALVIFPEGGNFTPRRRLRAIRLLEERRLAEEAAKASGHGAPAPAQAGRGPGRHRGRPHRRRRSSSPTPAWSTSSPSATSGGPCPWSRSSRPAGGACPPPRSPPDREAQVDWLYAWWARIDLWIGDNRPTALPRQDRQVGEAVQPRS